MRWPESEIEIFNGDSEDLYCLTLHGYPDRSVEVSQRDYGISILVQLIDNANPINTRFEIMEISHKRIFKRYQGTEFQVDDDSDISHIVDHIGLALGMAA